MCNHSIIIAILCKCRSLFIIVENCMLTALHDSHQFVDFFLFYFISNKVFFFNIHEIAIFRVECAHENLCHHVGSHERFNNKKYLSAAKVVNYFLRPEKSLIEFCIEIFLNNFFLHIKTFFFYAAFLVNIFFYLITSVNELRVDFYLSLVYNQ